MAFDFKNLDKKQISAFVVAILAGLGAVAFMNTHINTTIEKGSHAETLQVMIDRVQQLESNTEALYQRQEERHRQFQQQLQSVQRAAPVAPAQPIKEEQPRQSLALKTPPGKRALTIRIQTLQAVGGLLTPGDFVDILAQLSVPEDFEGPQSLGKTIITLFQNIQILAIGPNMAQSSNFEEQQKTAALPITFAVDPQEAELLSFAERHGQLQLVLRSPRETQAYKLDSANWATFVKYVAETQGIKLDAPVTIQTDPETPQLAPKPKIEIIRGGQR